LAVASRFRLRPLFVLCLVCLLLLLLRSELIRLLPFNLMNVILNKTLWRENQLAAEQQEAVAWAAVLADLSLGLPTTSPATSMADEPCSLIPALVTADHYRRKGDLQEMAGWLRQAAAAPPVPTVQKGVGLPGWTALDRDGNLGIAWSSPGWAFRPDSQEGQVVVEDDRFTLSYTNTPGQRDIVIYAWSNPIPVSYWHTVQFRAKVQPGTFFTFSIHTTSGDIRYLNYFPGNNQWETFTFSLPDEEIRYIYLSISEPAAEAATPIYQLEMEPLTFIFDGAANICS
jgi:hypothetical protein